jgi:hypothetical protein
MQRFMFLVAIAAAVTLAPGSVAAAATGDAVSGHGSVQGAFTSFSPIGAATFECRMTGLPTAVATGFNGSGGSGCELLANGAVIGTAPTLGTPGPVAVTASAAPMTDYDYATTTLTVCYSGWALYVDGTFESTSGCDDAIV